ncbi:MAG: hypothetical protein GY869_18100, partial [Planctomycetes bacterium]|nr:hypothetical protein [Planctomycetota bacterium]
PKIEEVLHVGEAATNTVTVTNSGPLEVNYRIGITDSSVSTSGYSIVVSSMHDSPVHIPAFKGKIEHGDVPDSIGLPPVDLVKNNYRGAIVPNRTKSRSGSFAQRRADVPDRDLSEPNFAYPPKMHTPIPSGAPAYGTEARSGDDRLVSFRTGTPSIISNIGVYTTNDDLIWASDFMPYDLNNLYAIDNQNKFMVIDVTNVNITTLGTSVPSPGLDWTGMAIDPDGTIYAAATDISISELYTIDPANGFATFIGEINNSPGSIAIAINANGKLFGVDIINDSLISINKKTGAGTIIGSLGFNANFGQGADFDYESGILYLAAFNQSSGAQLRIADLTTGNTTNVGALAINQMGSMAVATTNPPSWVVLPTNMGSVAAGGVSTFDV